MIFVCLQTLMVIKDEQEFFPLFPYLPSLAFQIFDGFKEKLMEKLKWGNIFSFSRISFKIKFLTTFDTQHKKNSL